MWLKAPLSKRAQEDARQTELLKEAWVESGKVYGHRKLHDDHANRPGDPESSLETASSCPRNGEHLTRRA